MAKNKTSFEIFISKRVQLFLTLAGVFIALLNIWIASKLAPIASDIAVIQEQVKSQEVQIVPRSELENQFINITQRLDRIEGKLDRLIEGQ